MLSRVVVFFNGKDLNLFKGSLEGVSREERGGGDN